MSQVGRSRTVGIVDYQAGNIQSIENALSHLGARVRRVVRSSDIGACTHLVLPGVGAFGFCADRLRASGLTEAVRHWSLEQKRPLLGICVGMQLLADTSEESPGGAGLGWIGGDVRRIPAAVSIRVPHVGWNTVEFNASCGEFSAGSSADFYFDHSYAWLSPERGEIVGTCTHGAQFCAVVRRGNLVAVQFHPEKSQAAGLRFLRGFVSQ